MHHIATLMLFPRGLFDTGPFDMFLGSWSKRRYFPTALREFRNTEISFAVRRGGYFVGRQKLGILDLEWPVTGLLTECLKAEFAFDKCLLEIKEIFCRGRWQTPGREIAVK